MDEGGATGNESGETEGGDRVGQELRAFFLDLLEGTNMQAYHADRDGYIKRKAGVSGWDDETTRLLQEGTLREIEEHVKRVTGSGNAWPVWVVFPPI